MCESRFVDDIERRLDPTSVFSDLQPHGDRVDGRKESESLIEVQGFEQVGVSCQKPLQHSCVK